jgi:hypothetical protein
MDLVLDTILPLRGTKQEPTQQQMANTGTKQIRYYSLCRDLRGHGIRFRGGSSFDAPIFWNSDQARSEYAWNRTIRLLKPSPNLGRLAGANRP